ncbi:hypothetical protein M427DRAFT_336705 [Gonapodya prolifera JEL478]|uniref:Brf1 TBP-binding domain-containing protein n=1 Tax=Gonapodya prolifera (strain JEL478) TaxID=1344416 RepID=A0A139AE23_GONPJ|nr:hypothetical protein M427DRAFT_336705 [Gonapodya prolifera JEL478]|eukprot:KXS14685.1 hypothetical protein M427DRAFT_336705 [Gonapodya prolifera JEL478]
MIAGRAMHFTRTQREMAALVKVCEATLRTRMEEFGETPSAQLTVKEFSALKGDELEANPADPPAFDRARKAEAAKNAASKIVKGESGESAKTATQAAKGKSAGAGKGLAKGRKQRGREMTEREREEEEDRLAEEEADVDNTLTEAGGAGNSVGDRDARSDAFEEEIPDYLPEATAAAATLVNPSQSSNPPAPTVGDEGAPATARSSAAGGNEPIVVEDDHLSEFDDDDDVAEALYDEDEVKGKEKIWSWENEDWLTEQDEKARRRLLDEANGIFEQPKKPRKKRKAPEEGADGEGGWKRSQNQQFNIEDVARAVVKREAEVKGSSRVNYGALLGLFKIPKDAGSSAEGAAGSSAEGAGATADEGEGASADEEEME